MLRQRLCGQHSITDRRRIHGYYDNYHHNDYDNNYHYNHYYNDHDDINNYYYVDYDDQSDNHIAFDDTFASK
jgi:hypothetical protein